MDASQPDCPKGYDIIGDVHGQSQKLERLLHAMDYELEPGAWRHPSRKAIFVGDLIDRGPGQLETCQIVRAMTQAGNALVVMGNHEFNAIAWSLRNKHGEPCRAHTTKNRLQHAAFLREVEEDPALHSEIIDWFLTFPLWLDLPEIRVIHACWNAQVIAEVSPLLSPGNRLDTQLVARASDGVGNSIRPDGSRLPSSIEFRAVETLLKGMEIDLPAGHSFLDNDHHRRTSVRTRWWDPAAVTYQAAALLPASAAQSLPSTSLPAEAICPYDGAKPLFLGHYWMSGEPTILTPSIACVDFSAGKGGPLVAYRWSGERALSDQNFISCD